MHQGCTASIKKNTYDSLAITNGSQGMKRVDLIVARYEKNRVNGIESIDLKVIQGTPAESNPAAPQCIEGDIQAGDYVADMPMYQVIIEGLNITEVKEMFKVIGSNKDLMDRLNLQILSNTDNQQIYTMYGGRIKVVSGTKVVNINMNTGYALLFGVDELKALFGDNYAITRLVITTYNADTIAQAVHFYAPEIWNREAYQYFYPINHSGSMRINYKLEYVYDFD